MGPEATSQLESEAWKLVTGSAWPQAQQERGCCEFPVDAPVGGSGALELARRLTAARALHCAMASRTLSHVWRLVLDG